MSPGPDRDEAPTDRVIRWGVIGSGGIARRRTIPEGIQAARNARLDAVFDANPQANAEVARTFGARAAESVDDLLRSDIDAVYIATPADAHKDDVLRCAGAGKHALCEKPLGLSVGEAETMIRACRLAGVTLGTALMMRFHSQHQAALDLLKSGRLGKPVFGRAQLSCWYPPMAGAWRQDPKRSGGGSLIDMGGHCIDLLEMLLGRVAAVSCAVNRTVHDYSAEDSAVATLYFDNGALGVVDTFFCIPDECAQNVLELYGSQGSIVARHTVGQGEQGEMTAYLRADVAGYAATQARMPVKGEAVAPEPINIYQAEVEEFSRAIIERRDPANGPEIGLNNQRILAACYESARTGRRVPVAS